MTGFDGIRKYAAKKAEEAKAKAEEERSARTPEPGFVFYEACWLTEKAHDHNASLRPPSEVRAANEERVEKISGAYRPLLRPNAEYRITMQTRDSVGSTSHDRAHVVAFRTAGPVGHFHEIATPAGPKPHPAYEPQRFALEKLTPYIDMQRSYPAADGNMVGAKPLYYEDPDIRLYFVEPYVERFFTTWRDLGGGLGELESSLDLELLDPATDPNPPDWSTPDPTPVHTTVAHHRADGVVMASAQLRFVADAAPLVPRDVQMLSNLIASGPACADGLQPPEIPASHVEVAAENLRPQALYTASWRATFEGVSREVHQYQFATSRYGSHAAQVHSYPVRVVPTKESDGPPDGAAAADGDDPTTHNGTEPEAAPEVTEVVLAVEELAAPSDPAAIAAVVSGTVADDVRREYATRYDQLREAVLALPPAPPAEGTEITAVVDPGSTDTDDMKTVALLVRNPEPFNDPRLPEATIARTVTAPGLETIVAPDTARLFLVRSDGLPIDGGDCVLSFEYWGFKSDGTEVKSTETVEIQVPGTPPPTMGATAVTGAPVGLPLSPPESTDPNDAGDEGRQ